MVELADLMAAVAHPPGTWFWLLDEDTEFSTAPDRYRHPFVLPEGFDPEGRRALASGLPRSSQPPDSGQDKVDYLKHAAHGTCDGKQCDLDRPGWIKPLTLQVAGSWLVRGAFICVEPNMTVLGQIQVFEDEAAVDA